MICPNCKKENMNEKAVECAYCHTPFYDSQEQAVVAVKSITRSQVLENIGKTFLAIIVASAVLLAALFVVPNLPKKESVSNGNNASQDLSNNQNNNSNNSDLSQSGNDGSNWNDGGLVDNGSVDVAGNSSDGAGSVSSNNSGNNSVNNSGNSSNGNSGSGNGGSSVKTYQTNETWKVPGLWEITFKGAAMHYFCNSYDDNNNAMNYCVTLVYDVKNIGYKDIYLSLFSVYDEEGEKANAYACTHDDNSVSLSPGGKKTGATATYAIKNRSSYVTVVIKEYVNVNGEVEVHEARFKIEVSSGESGNAGNDTVTLPNDIKYYREYPEVPDFGAMVNVAPDQTVNEYGGTAYAYNPSKVKANDPNGTAMQDYFELLKRCGYQYAGGYTNEYGEAVVAHEHSMYGWRVSVGGTGTSIVITVFPI